MANRRKNWTRYDDERLLDMRICDLGLKIEGTPLVRRVERLHRETEARGIRHRPHVWLSNEWFSPDGIPGIAIPFYLAHPRLKRLEYSQMLEVDGGNEADCMRVLRHEAGHAIDTAYRLHRRKSWREVFGKYSVPYPTSYKPEPNSRNYVVHLKAWYAQAHPAEDFAETFAVWLAPGSRWRKRYRDWDTALRKLEYVDELMREVAGTTPPVRKRARIDPLREIKTTLRKHYDKKRKHYGTEWPDFYDRDLARLFTADTRNSHRLTAARFLRGLRREIRERVAEWTGAHSYLVDQVLEDVIERCREKKLRLAVTPEEAKTDAVLMVTVHTMKSMHWVRREIPL